MGVAIRFALFSIVAGPVRLTTLTAAYRQNDHPSNDSLSEKLFLTILQPPRESSRDGKTSPGRGFPVSFRRVIVGLTPIRLELEPTDSTPPADFGLPAIHDPSQPCPGNGLRRQREHLLAALP